MYGEHHYTDMDYLTNVEDLLKEADLRKMIERLHVHNYRDAILPKASVEHLARLVGLTDIELVRRILLAVYSDIGISVDNKEAVLEKLRTTKNNELVAAAMGVAMRTASTKKMPKKLKDGWDVVAMMTYVEESIPQTYIGLERNTDGFIVRLAPNNIPAQFRITANTANDNRDGIIKNVNMKFRPLCALGADRILFSDACDLIRMPEADVYADYMNLISWIRGNHNLETIEHDMSYWRERLSPATPLLDTMMRASNVLLRNRLDIEPIEES
jgi:hypothetical protein